MVISLNMEHATRDRMSVQVSPLAELMACLHVLAEPDHHPESRRWVDGVRARLSPPLWAEAFRFGPLWARYRMRLFYPADRREPGSLSDQIAALVSTAADQFVPLAAHAIRGRDLGFSTAADVLADHTWVAECHRRSFNRGELASSLVADPAAFAADLADVLLACEREFFAEEWLALEPRLARAAEIIDERVNTWGPLPAVESVSGMASSRGSTSTVFFDKLQTASGAVDEHGLVLVPSVRAWPHVMVKLDPGLPVVVQYLVSEVRGEASAQSQTQLRRQLFALAEPGRWELCRHLIGEPITTRELAVRTGLSEPAVSRHLRALRNAGLVSSQRDGRQVFHRMHTASILHLGHDVLSALIR